MRLALRACLDAYQRCILRSCSRTLQVSNGRYVALAPNRDMSLRQIYVEGYTFPHIASIQRISGPALGHYSAQCQTW